MDAVLWGNGIGNFVMATPFLQNLRKPVVYIPKDDKRREAIESISIYPVKVFENEDNWDRFKRIYQMWCAPQLDKSNVIVQTKPKLHNWNHAHEVEWNMELTKGGVKYDPIIKHSDGWRIHTAQHEQLIAVSNGANQNWTNKQLSDDKLIELVNRLREKYIVVFFGGVDEKKMGKMLEDKCHILNFAGRLSLSSTLGTMRQCDKLITTDSGLMHCAGAMGMDLICLWGGTWWNKNSPISKGQVIRIDGEECPHKPCYGKPEMHECRKNICMDIDIDKVMEVL